MSKFVSLLLVLLTAKTFLAYGQANPSVIFNSIQDELLWMPDNAPRSYDSGTLSQARSRDASVFGEYGLKRLDRQDFRRRESAMAVEICELIDPTAAYGIFTFLRRPLAKPIKNLGELAVEQDSKILFLQNRFLVTLEPSSPSPAIREILLQAGGIVSDALPRLFSVPPIVKRLPKENLVPQTDLFALGFRALNQKYSLGTKDHFGLSHGAEAVMAEYQMNGDSARMLLIQYPTQQLAKKFLESGYREYSAQHANESIFFKRDGPQVALVIGAKSAEVATALLDKVSYVSTVTWDPKVQPLTVAQMMVNIFVFTGILLGMTVMAGCAFGVLRIILKRMFPDTIFDRSKSAELIRLDLLNPKK